MQLEWLGKYRPLVETMFKAANSYSQTYRNEIEFKHGKLCSMEIQILESIMEHGDMEKNMKWHAKHLGFSPSNYSKHVNKLVKKGFIDKYHVEGNNKDIVLQVSDAGMALYKEYTLLAKKTWFDDFYKYLDTLPKETLEEISKFIGIWGSWFDVEKEVDSPKLLKKI